MREMKSVAGVRRLYQQSFLDLIEFPSRVDTPEIEQEFSELLETIYERHSKVLVQMARGAYELRHALSNGQLNAGGAVRFDDLDSTHAFLDRFYLCRIGIRVLIGQYLALRQPPVENYVGIICSQTSPYEIVKRAIDDAAFMCTRKYGDAPDVLVTGKLEQTFPYVPTHLRTCYLCVLLVVFLSCCLSLFLLPNCTSLVCFCVRPCSSPWQTTSCWSCSKTA